MNLSTCGVFGIVYLVSRRKAGWVARYFELGTFLGQLETIQ
jgi:hypothetical protein